MNRFYMTPTTGALLLAGQVRDRWARVKVTSRPKVDPRHADILGVIVVERQRLFGDLKPLTPRTPAGVA